MKAQRRTYGNALVISIEGRLDHDTTPEFREFLMGCLAQAAQEQLSVVLDLKNLEYLSSAGLNSLIVGSRAARKDGTSMYAAALQPMVREMWDISHLTLLVQTFSSVKEALEGISDGAAQAFSAAGA